MARFALKLIYVAVKAMIWLPYISQDTLFASAGDGFTAIPKEPFFLALSISSPFTDNQRLGHQLNIPELQVLKVSLMNTHSLSSSALEPGADGAGIMAMMRGGVSLTGPTIEHLQSPGHIFQGFLEIGHGSVMPFADIGATSLTRFTPLTNSLLAMPTIAG